jgi:peptidoglycan-associated lipoprotein
MRIPAPARTIALLSLVLLAVGCKKKPVDGAGDGVAGPPVPSVDQSMQVVSVSPSTVAPGAPAKVQIIGSGFAAGAALQVGPQRVSAVQFLNENVLSATLPPMAAGSYDVTVALPTGASSTLRGALRVADASVSVSIDRARCGQVVVYFDTDQAGLSPTSRSRLDSVMDCYTSGSHTIRLTGHADERGTTDYNVALGQRRAEAVRDHLMRAGVPAGRLPITSYGEEKPAERGYGEQVWAKNRRVELVIP